MSMRKVWQAVSLLVLVAWAAPVAGLALTRDAAYVPIAGGVVLLELLVRALHLVPLAMHRGVLARPAGARDCSGLNGMPSGHVAIVTFAALSCLYAEVASGRLSDARAVFAARVGCSALVGAVAAARVAVACHTPLQAVAGALLGALASLVVAAALARGSMETERESVDKI